MRILHADTDDLDNPLHGGQPVRTYEINSRLAARHDITVFTAVYKGCRRRLEREGVKYRRLGFRLPPFGLSPHLSFLAALGPAVRRAPHDLAVEEFTPPVGFCLLPRWTQKPVVSIVQWFFFQEWHARYHLPFERWMRSLAARNQQLYRRFIVQTGAMQREFQAMFPQAQVRKIPCGVSDELFRLEPARGDYALYLGRLAPGKGLDLLLDAWRDGCAARGIPLVIAGAGPELGRLARRTADEGLSQSVRFVGWVSGQDKLNLLQQCRFKVLPSRSETLGLTALEALAAGKPVLAFNIPNLDEIVRPPWGALAPAFEAGQLGKLACELWAQPEHCAEMGRQAREFANSFRWDALAKEQEAFYLEAVREQEVAPAI